jgi:hypothetical protein
MRKGREMRVEQVMFNSGAVRCAGGHEPVRNALNAHSPHLKGLEITPLG